MQNYNQERLNKMIQSRFRQETKFLNLFRQYEYWSDIILMRDWSIVKKLSLGSLQRYSEKCEITNNSIKVLVELQWPNLESLLLNSNNIKDHGVSMIMQKFANQLSQLNLFNCRLTSYCINQMKQSMKNIKILSLSQNKIGNQGAKLLAKVCLNNLERLYIDYCQIQSEGFKHLTKSKWDNISFLSKVFNYATNKESQLNSWQMMNQTQYKKLKQFNMAEKQPICLFNYVLFQGITIKICLRFIKIQNNIEKQIMDILLSRGFQLI